jgi:hypothetical protein
VIDARIVSVREETAIVIVNVSGSAIEETVIMTAAPAIGAKTSVSACIAHVEILVEAGMSSITVIPAALPVQTVAAVEKATPRVLPVGLPSDIAGIAVSGIAARVPAAVDGSVRRFLKRKARRMKRQFTLVAKRERSRRIRLGCVCVYH